MPMYILQNKPGSVSIGEVFIKNRDAGATDKNVVKKLISTANSADLLIIFKHYSVYVEEYSGKSICPLPGHANERTPNRKSTRLNSSHQIISYAVFCLKKKKTKQNVCERIKRYSYQ